MSDSDFLFRTANLGSQNARSAVWNDNETRTQIARGLDSEFPYKDLQEKVRTNGLLLRKPEWAILSAQAISRNLEAVLDSLIWDTRNPGQVANLTQVYTNGLLGTPVQQNAAVVHNLIDIHLPSYFVDMVTRLATRLSIFDPTPTTLNVPAPSVNVSLGAANYFGGALLQADAIAFSNATKINVSERLKAQIRDTYMSLIMESLGAAVKESNPALWKFVLSDNIPVGIAKP